MINDPIINELRKHKAEIAKEYNNDIRLLADAMNKAAVESGVKLVDRKPKKTIVKTGS